MPLNFALSNGLLDPATLDVHIAEIAKLPESLLGGYSFATILALWDPFLQIETAFKMIPDRIFEKCQNEGSIPLKLWPILTASTKTHEWLILLLKCPPDIDEIETYLAPLLLSSVWTWISRQSLPISFLEKYHKSIIWSEAFKITKFDEKFLTHRMIWSDLSTIDIEMLCQHQTLSISFMEQHIKRLHKSNISRYQNLSEDFMRRNFTDLNMIYLIQFQKMSEKFVADFASKLDWYEICMHKQLSMGFLEQHTNYLNWGNVSEFQHLSVDFIHKHSRRLNSVRLAKNRRVTAEMMT